MQSLRGILQPRGAFEVRTGFEPAYDGFAIRPGDENETSRDPENQAADRADASPSVTVESAECTPKITDVSGPEPIREPIETRLSAADLDAAIARLTRAMVTATDDELTDLLAGLRELKADLRRVREAAAPSNVTPLFKSR